MKKKKGEKAAAIRMIERANPLLQALPALASSFLPFSQLPRAAPR